MVATNTLSGTVWTAHNEHKYNNNVKQKTETIFILNSANLSGDNTYTLVCKKSLQSVSHRLMHLLHPFCILIEIRIICLCLYWFEFCVHWCIGKSTISIGCDALWDSFHVVRFLTFYFSARRWLAKKKKKSPEEHIDKVHQWHGFVHNTFDNASSYTARTGESHKIHYITKVHVKCQCGWLTTISHLWYRTGFLLSFWFFLVRWWRSWW